MLTTINSWPTTLKLTDHDQPLLVCEQPLRHLKGKRLACRGTWNNKPVLIKLFLHPQSAERHMQREMKGVERLINNKLSTPDLLFCGILDDGTPILIFEYLTKAQTALEHWNALKNDPQRLFFLNQLVELLAAQHACGIWQNDLHLENFLVSHGNLYSIDGDDVQQEQHSSHLSNKNRRDNLALLFAQLPPQMEPLFSESLQHYSHRDSVPSNEDWLTIIHHELPLLRTKRRQNYIQKSYRTCSEFIRYNAFNTISIFRRDINPDLQRALQVDPDQLMQTGTLLKDGNSATVVMVKVGGSAWVIKRYNIKSWWHGLKRCWRPTRAWISWGNAHRLSISHINTPQAVALIEKRLGPLRFGGYYVCAAIEAPNSCDLFVEDKFTDDDKKDIKGSFISLFEMFLRLGINHGDCKGTNFLIHDNSVWVIDLDAMSEPNKQHRFRRGFNTDRRRFLRNWDKDKNLQQWFDEHLPS